MAGRRGRIDKLNAVSPALLAEVFAQSSRGRDMSAAERVRQFIDANAWNEAALALIDIELPRWSLVSLAFDDGEWSCILSRHPQLPNWLNDSIEARHPVMSLAILAAIVDACEIEMSIGGDSITSVPACRPWHEFADTVCCDNFA
jgi:hypothetical protein